MNIDVPASVGAPPLDTQHYYAEYFDFITVGAQYSWTCVKGGVHRHFSDVLTGAQNIQYICAIHMWQSCVEIEDYSVTYFNCIAMFKALYYKTPIKGGAHTHFVDVHASTNYIWALPLM